MVLGRLVGKHMNYMNTRVDRTPMLKSQEEIEGTRESHGWADDEEYTPLVATVALSGDEEEGSEE